MDLHTLTPNKSAQVRRSAEQWRTLMQQFSTSGLTRDRFCKDQGIALSTFDYWRRKLKQQDVPGHQVDTPMFVELSSAPASAPASDSPPWDVELQLGDAVILRLRRPAC